MAGKVEKNQAGTYSKYRILEGPARWVFITLSTIAVVLFICRVFNLAPFGFAMLGFTFYYVLLGIYLPMGFLYFPWKKGPGRGKITPSDIFLAVLVGAACFYLSANPLTIAYGGWGVYPPLIAFIAALVIWFLLLELGRRAVGLMFSGVVALFSFYPLFANFMPGPLWGKNYSMLRTAAFHAISDGSILGPPMQVFASILGGYMVFAVVLQVVGGADFFRDFALSIMGHLRGGAAKVSIFTSSLFGSISGSVAANIVATGSFTIPTMKK